MSSLQNAIRILSLFTDGAPVVRVGELSKQLGLPKSSVSRLLRDLTDACLVERDLNGRGFRAGPELFRLGSLYLSRFPLDEVLAEELQQIVSAYLATAYIGVLNGPDLVIMRRFEGPHPVRYILEPGARLPAYETALGKILLARQPAKTVLAGLPDRIVNETRGIDMSREELARELEQASCAGYATIDLRPLGIEAYAVAFRQVEDRDVGLAICFSRDSMSEDRKADALDALVTLGRKMAEIFGDPSWRRR